MLSGVELQNSKRGKHIIKFPITINSSMLLNNRFELTTYTILLTDPKTYTILLTDPKI